MVLIVFWESSENEFGRNFFLTIDGFVKHILEHWVDFISSFAPFVLHYGDTLFASLIYVHLNSQKMDENV